MESCAAFFQGAPSHPSCQPSCCRLQLKGRYPRAGLCFSPFSGLRFAGNANWLSAKEEQAAVFRFRVPQKPARRRNAAGESEERGFEVRVLEKSAAEGASLSPHLAGVAGPDGMASVVGTAPIRSIRSPPDVPRELPLSRRVVNRAPLRRVSSESLQYDAGMLGEMAHKGASIPVTNEGKSRALSYLTRILSSGVYDVAVESPLEAAPRLSERTGTRILLKREDLQPVFSFKLRGAYNMMSKIPQEQLDHGVICSSAGNHAQGVALAAQKLNCHAVIAMPVTTPEIKWKSVKRLGATVVLVGDSYDEAEAYALQRGLDEGRVFVPPFDHPDVIAGQGTIGMEIVRQHPGPLHAVFVPVGGGGLIAGIAAYMKQVRPEVRIIGVEPADANAMALSLHYGERVILNQVGGFADGVAVKCVGEETFQLCRELVDGVVLVSRDAICAAIKDMFEEKRSILEPAGALALAGAVAYCKYYNLREKSVVAVTSGANMNFDRLRLVTDLAEVGACREAVLATFIPEMLGSFKSFLALVGPMNITEFRYRYDVNKEKALVLCSVGLHQEKDLDAMKDRLRNAGLRTLDLTKNDLAKDHLRHLMGGRTTVRNEVLYRFVFPEKPGALMKFLNRFSPRWNISLFHYRAQGEIGANVLVGIQVPEEDEEELTACADALGYEYRDERENVAFRLIMR